jgi:hypothetical protein
MNAERLSPAVFARESTECAAPGCATISANARPTRGSLNMAKRSFQVSAERSERRAAQQGNEHLFEERCRHGACANLLGSQLRDGGPELVL